MNFDAESGELSCQSCGRHENIENFPEELVTAAFSEDEAKEYHCENCGAVFITLAETTATRLQFLWCRRGDCRSFIRPSCSCKGDSFYH